MHYVALSATGSLWRNSNSGSHLQVRNFKVADALRGGSGMRLHCATQAGPPLPQEAPYVAHSEPGGTHSAAPAETLWSRLRAAAKSPSGGTFAGAFQSLLSISCHPLFPSVRLALKQARRSRGLQHLVGASCALAFLGMRPVGGRMTPATGGRHFFLYLKPPKSPSKRRRRGELDFL